MDLYVLLHIACSQELVLGGVFLLFRSKGVRFRAILGTLVLITGVFGFLLFFNNLNRPMGTFTFLSPVQLLSGTLNVLFIASFVIELVRPGWLSWWRAFKLVLPWLFLSGIYLGGVWLCGEQIRNLANWTDLVAHIGEFNVWFRFVLVVQTFGYLFLMFWVLVRYRSLYDDWCARNYADTERMDISWASWLVWGYLLTIILFWLLLLNVGEGAYLAHRVVYLLVFGYVIYKALFHVNPYPKDHFRQTMDESEAEASEVIGTGRVTAEIESEEQFLHDLPGYVQTVRAWMEAFKPYLRQGFKLIDVSEVLPLNRTYLSRIFNEGMGGTFSEVVMGYRIGKAKQLLTEENIKKMDEIAKLSGFSSVSSLYKAFQKQMGMTPKQFVQLNQPEK